MAPRYTALQKDEMVPIVIPEATEEVKECPLHPKVCLINQGSYFSSLLRKQEGRKKKKEKRYLDAFVSTSAVLHVAHALIACEQSLCLGKKIARKGKGREGGREPFSLFPLPNSPLDQRPVHRLMR